jgi:hypothetical protein
MGFTDPRIAQFAEFGFGRTVSVSREAAKRGYPRIYPLTRIRAYAVHNRGASFRPAASWAFGDRSELGPPRRC